MQGLRHIGAQAVGQLRAIMQLMFFMMKRVQNKGLDTQIATD